MNDRATPGIEIPDDALDAEAILQQIQQQVSRRRAAGAYGPDPATFGPGSLRPRQSGVAADHDPVGFPGLQDSLAELIATSALREPDFVSNAPLVGPLIVSVRRLWNRMSTKWYVLPILRQQTEVNTRTARVISDLAQWHELDAHHLHQLERRVAELETRLASLEVEAKS